MGELHIFCLFTDSQTVFISPPHLKYSALPEGVDRFKLPWGPAAGCCSCNYLRISAAAFVSSSGIGAGTISPGVSGGGMFFHLPIKSTLSSSTTGTGSPSLMFSSLPGLVMSIISAAMPSEFFFFDFKVDFRELVVFEPWAPHRGITVMNASQLDKR